MYETEFKYPFKDKKKLLEYEYSIYILIIILKYKRKEPNKKPKKTKLGRLFQKKRKVLEVEVVENNPNIVIKQNKFIKVIKWLK